MAAHTLDCRRLWNKAMNFEISSMDLLYLALSVIGYAASATLWVYFAAPRQELGALPLADPGSITSPDSTRS